MHLMAAGVCLCLVCLQHLLIVISDAVFTANLKNESLAPRSRYMALIFSGKKCRLCVFHGRRVVIAHTVKELFMSPCGTWMKWEVRVKKTFWGESGPSAHSLTLSGCRLWNEVICAFALMDGCSGLPSVAASVSSSVFITHDQYLGMSGGAADTQQAPLIVSGTDVVISPPEPSGGGDRYMPEAPFPLRPRTHHPTLRIQSSSGAPEVPKYLH